MKKNPAENFATIEVDPISGEYYITIPQWILDEKQWYEGTTVNIEDDGNSIIITEVTED